MKKYNLSRHLGLALLIGGSAVGLLQAASVQETYNLNCASCHGKDGQGLTEVGKSLKARNFLTEPFKQGDSIEQIGKTLETGVPGTLMVGYSYLKPEDRKALAKYVFDMRQVAKTATQAALADAKVEQSTVTKKEVVAAAPVEEQLKPQPVSPSTEKTVETKPVQKAVEKVVKTVAEIIPPKAEAPKAAETQIKAKADAGGEDPKLTLGRQVYKMQGCNSCHGDNGQADTPTGMALKARNFVKGDYKLGGDMAGIKKVMAEGIPGSPMIAYPQIQGEELESLATFLLALKGNPSVAKDPAPSVPSGSGEISISYAMELMAEPERSALHVKFDKSSKGAAIYATSCAECHGDNGQGGVSIRMISSAPYYRVKTLPILGHDGDWMKRSNFDKLVTEGLPGRLKPGMGTITKEDLNALYNFFVESRNAVK